MDVIPWVHFIGLIWQALQFEGTGLLSSYLNCHYSCLWELQQVLVEALYSVDVDS